jgi:hypothetical protein
MHVSYQVVSTNGRAPMSSRIKVAAPTLVICLVATSTSAQAIRCNGNFQVVNGQEISTPYCRDNALAAVARERGLSVSDATVRNNPARKQEICRWIGSDIRTRPACDEVLPDGDGNR